jgi:ABC-type sulfate transport system substrate-binding protein
MPLVILAKCESGNAWQLPSAAIPLMLFSRAQNKPTTISIEDTKRSTFHLVFPKKKTANFTRYEYVVKKTILNALNVRFAQFFKNGEVQGNSKVKKESGRLAGDP